MRSISWSVTTKVVGELAQASTDGVDLISLAPTS
jgi:hypothetical protein